MSVRHQKEFMKVDKRLIKFIGSKLLGIGRNYNYLYIISISFGKKCIDIDNFKKYNMT